MPSAVYYHASELSPEQRQAFESLLGYGLDDDEGITLQTSKSRVISRALTGEAGKEAHRKWLAFADEMASRVKDVPEAELDDALDEALEYVRSHPE